MPNFELCEVMTLPLPGRVGEGEGVAVEFEVEGEGGTFMPPAPMEVEQITLFCREDEGECELAGWEKCAGSCGVMVTFGLATNEIEVLL